MSEIKPVAYFRATKEHGIIWGEDCCCEDPIFDGDDNYDERETFSMAVYPAAALEALQAENAELKSTISDLTKAYERESNDCLKALEERDYWYDKADALADKISEVFDVPIGEHSNVNCPIVEAMKILCGEYVTKFDKESAAQAKRIAHLEYKIDELMLEYCPDEMTPEQLKNYAKHQRKVSL